MLFNSVEFAFFLPLVFLLYWFVFNRNLKVQNLFLIAASYLFYGWWDVRFLSLIAFSSLVDYSIGIWLSKTEHSRNRKLLLALSICVNIGFLGFFKYFNFFAESFADAFTLLGQSIEPSRLNIILPVGISFYTFQTLSYTIDVYRKKLEPTKDAVAFFAFVSFFPQLVAGPIERATNLLPQFYKSRIFEKDKAIDGLRQILWGLFKKMVIADNCAEYVNLIFNNSSDYSGTTLVLGALLFTFQIYGDFSGYSDIAIGTARLFGFNLMRNFAFPYFSRDIAEFWRRWHISLSTWFRDYVYIPLGGSRMGTWGRVRNTFIIFVVSGFWHGANWTFIVWGALNALYFLPLLLLNQNRKNIDAIDKDKFLPSLREFFGMFITFWLTVLAWIFFRAESLGHAWQYISDLFIGLFAKAAYVETLGMIRWEMGFSILGLIGVLLLVEWIGRHHQHALEFRDSKVPAFARWIIYYTIAIAILLLGGAEQEFIYFQF